MTLFSYILLSIIGVLFLTMIILFIVKKVRDKKSKAKEVSNNGRSNK